MKKKRGRVPGSVRATKEDRGQIQKIAMAMSRERQFHCLLREFDVAGYQRMLRQRGFTDPKALEFLTIEQLRRREALKYTIWKTAQGIPNEKGGAFIRIAIETTCRCYKSHEQIQSAKDFLNHLEGRDAMGVPDYSEKYKTILKEVHPSWVFNDSPYGPKNTLSETALNKDLKKIEVLVSPPQPKQTTGELPPDPYLEGLKRDAGKDPAYKKRYEEELKISRDKERKEKTKMLSQTETIADALETTRGIIRKEKQRLKKWNML